MLLEIQNMIHILLPVIISFQNAWTSPTLKYIQYVANLSWSTWVQKGVFSLAQVLRYAYLYSKKSRNKIEKNVPDISIRGYGPTIQESDSD